MKSTTRRADPRWLLLVLLAILLYGLLTFELYVNVTSRMPGANDFYSRWAGARAMLLQHENPYSDSVTRQIQLGMLGRLAGSNEDQVAFAYPLYSAFIAAPLVMLPYPLAQAIWMMFLCSAVLASAVVLARLSRFPLALAALTALVIGCLAFYPTVRGVFMGQFALVSFFFLVMGIAAVHAHRDEWAGVFLALATVKPQVALFLVPTILLWAALHRRWRIVGGTAAALAGLTVLGMLWVPQWLPDFVQAVLKYTEYAKAGPPLQTAIEWFVPAPGGTTLAVGASLALIAWMALRVVRTAPLDWMDFQPSLHWVAIVTTLAAGRIGSPDQVILLIPWVYWISDWIENKQLRPAVAGALAALVLPWLVFLLTLRGNTELLVVTTVLPLFTAAVGSARALGTRKAYAGAV